MFQLIRPGSVSISLCSCDKDAIVQRDFWREEFILVYNLGSSQSFLITKPGIRCMRQLVPSSLQSSSLLSIPPSPFLKLALGWQPMGWVYPFQVGYLGETSWNHCHRHVQRCRSIPAVVLKSSQVDNKDLAM